jgi:hypothetical protein
MRCAAALLLLAVTPLAAAATPIDVDRVCRLVASEAGAASLAAPDLARLDRSPTRQRQLPLVRNVMAAPADAPCRAARLAQSAAEASTSPAAAMRWLAGVGGVAPAAAPSREQSPRISAVDPLAAALDWLRPLAETSAMPWPPPLPGRSELPEPLRRELAILLGAIGSAHRQLEAATRHLTANLDASNLRAQALHGAPAAAPEHDLLRLLPLLDRPLLAGGMIDLVDAVERFARFAAAAHALPSIDWQVDTPLGMVIVDTTGRDNARTLAAPPLLLVDVGGNDRTTFTAALAPRRISVLIDHGGDDRYIAAADGADPSAATLGYGVLWDSSGDDVYEGMHLAQAAAVLGAALLVDSGGANAFDAPGHAQGYAFGGLALLLAGEGQDRYRAVTHAQASAGPDGAAALIDRGGNDAYTLADSPLARPSPQLPGANTSMGQGAGRGLRPTAEDKSGAAGGIGALIDLAGDDRYRAQVFAQGTGFHEGLGILVDAGGADVFDAAWYAMGAAAHSAAGVLLALGGGADRYRATHSTSLGAAHDESIAVFVDDGGDEHYALGDLGLGASHDDGVALFLEAGGANRYRVEAAACRAFGFTPADDTGGGRTPVNKAVFVDRGCAGIVGCERTCAGR